MCEQGRVGGDSGGDPQRAYRKEGESSGYRARAEKQKQKQDARRKMKAQKAARGREREAMS